MDEINFDDLCELAARAGRAPIAIIARLDREEGTHEVLGRYGTAQAYSKVLKSPDIALPMLDPITMPLIAVRNLAEEPAFAGHPITKFKPEIHSLIAAILKSRGAAERVTLSLANPDAVTFDDPDAFACLSKLISVYRQLLSGMEVAETAAVQSLYAPVEQTSFHEAAAAVGPAAKFLLDTLLHKRSLRSRKAATFISLRGWRKTIKEHQIAALAAVKQDAPPAFVAAAADEIVDAARHLYGDQTIKTVVPVPGGSSGLATSFSELLAQDVARKLNCQCIGALAGSLAERGASHPKKSSRLMPYKVVEPVTGATLIVDDVVTSGRHLELAQTALRVTGATCFAIAWIGG